MKNKHPKRKMARKMLTKSETENHTPIFDSKAWEARKELKAKRNLNK